MMPCTASNRPQGYNEYNVITGSVALSRTVQCSMHVVTKLLHNHMTVYRDRMHATGCTNTCRKITE